MSLDETAAVSAGEISVNRLIYACHCFYQSVRFFVGYNCQHPRKSEDPSLV